MGLPDHSTTALITGIVSGFLVSIPVGPINLTIINEGARRGFKWAIFIGMGSVAMETIYCAAAFAGFSAFLGPPMVKATVELLSFLFMLYLGFKFLRAKSIPTHSHSADLIEEKLHPHSAFMTGFVRVLGNPGVLLMWTALAATFLSHDWVDATRDDKIACVLGVALGAASWFFLLSYGVSWGRRKISSSTLLKMEHVSGAVMLGVALVIGARIVWHLARHKVGGA